MKKIKKHLGNLLIAAIEMAVGILLLVDPINFTTAIIRIFGALVVVGGIIKTVIYFRTRPIEGAINHSLTEGILMLLAGAICIFRTGWFIGAFPVLTVLYGISVLVLGLIKLTFTVDLMRIGVKRITWSAVSALISIICAVLIIADPFNSAKILWIFISVSLIVEAVVDILSLFLTKNKNSSR